MNDLVLMAAEEAAQHVDEVVLEERTRHAEALDALRAEHAEEIQRLQLITSTISSSSSDGDAAQRRRASSARHRRRASIAAITSLLDVDEVAETDEDVIYELGRHFAALPATPAPAARALAVPATPPSAAPAVLAVPTTPLPAAPAAPAASAAEAAPRTESSAGRERVVHWGLVERRQQQGSGRWRAVVAGLTSGGAVCILGASRDVIADPRILGWNVQRESADFCGFRLRRRGAGGAALYDAVLDFRAPDSATQQSWIAAFRALGWRGSDDEFDNAACRVNVGQAGGAQRCRAHWMSITTRTFAQAQLSRTVG